MWKWFGRGACLGCVVVPLGLVLLLVVELGALSKGLGARGYNSGRPSSVSCSPAVVRDGTGVLRKLGSFGC